MKNSAAKTIAVAAVVLIAFSLVPLSKGQNQTHNYTATFLLQNQPGGDQTYQLNITIPQTLYDYYASDNHAVLTPQDFARFVTPYALEPIAQRLWQIYNNTEDFTNGVLMIVHQLTYDANAPETYPVQTLVSGIGKCDLFSFIAASILQAGGINTVLLYYQSQEHMNIGVELANQPTEARTNVYCLQYQNATYYTAETTGGDWQTGWRVGECPPEYTDASPQVITLQNAEQPTVGQVSATIEELTPSTLTLKSIPPVTIGDSKITLSGQVNPAIPNQTVTLQAQINNSPWTTIATVQTQANGQFQYSWKPTTNGEVTVQASWQGNQQINGSASAQTSTILLTPFLIDAVAIVLITAATLTFAIYKKRNKGLNKTNQLN